MAEAAVATSAASKPPSAPSGGTVSSRAMNVESQRLGTLQEALAKKRSTLNAPAGGRPRSFSGGLQNAMLEGFQGSLPTTTDETGAIAQEGDEMVGQAAQMAREESFRSRFQSMQQGAKDRLLESEAGQKAKEEIRKEVRKAAWNAIRRGIEYLYDFLVGPSVDGGSMGVSLIVDVVGYAFSLVDLNIQMIWGYYITKKKSILFPALEWAPLKVPLPDIILHAAVIFLDLVVVFVLGLLCLVTLIILLLPFLAPVLGIVATYELFTNPALRSGFMDVITSAIGAQ